MDIFDVLRAISKRKVEFMRLGLDEKKAIKKAELDISQEFRIPLYDIKRIYRIG